MANRNASQWCLVCSKPPISKCYSTHSVLDRETVFDYLRSRALDKELSMFCGAGISRWRPSNKPLAGELKHQILDSLWKKLPEKSPSLLASTEERLSLEELISRSGWGIEFSLEKVFSNKGSRPNPWHEYIAGLLRNNLVPCVFTTNFDRLLELAAGDVGLESPQQYGIVSNERYEPDYKEDLGTSEKPTLCYLHGTYYAWDMCVTVPHVIDPILAETRLRGLEGYLKGKNRCMLVVGYSASDRDVTNMLRRNPSKFNAEVISIRSEPDWAFSGLEGCFRGLRGFKLGVPGHEEFLKKLWPMAKGGRWKWNSKNPLTHDATRWRRIMQSWANSLPTKSIPDIIERICSREPFQPDQSDPKITVAVEKDTVEIVGDIVVINVKHSKKNKYSLMKYTPNSGVLLWPEFNRRMRSLGYLNKSKDIEIGWQQLRSTHLCNFKEKEISFYLKQLIEAEKSSLISRSDKNLREFLPKAEALLESHPLLHELVREK